MTQTNIRDKQSVALVGFSLLEADCNFSSFQPNYINIWEDMLFARSQKITGRRNWLFNRFGMDDDHDYRNASYRDALNGLTMCCNQAFKTITNSTQSQIRKNKLGLLYFDSWGEPSIYEMVNSWRDSISVDMLPKSIARDYTVQDFSFKTRGERTGALQCLRVGIDILKSHIVDTVLICGLYRSFPSLVFSEAFSTKKAKSYNINNCQYIIERIACMVLRNDDNASRYISLTDYFLLPESQRLQRQILAEKWQQLITPHTKGIYGGVLPWQIVSKTEQQAVQRLKSSINYYNIFNHYGESGCINPLVAIHQAFNDMTTKEASLDKTHLQPSSSDFGHSIVNAQDKYNGVWLIECWQQQ